MDHSTPPPEFVRRLRSKLDTTDPNSCWLWQGAKHKQGYGFIAAAWMGIGQITTHRASFIIHKGAIPAGKVVMHACGNPACCNPEHLVLGGRGQQMALAAERGLLNGASPLCPPTLFGEANPRSKLTNELVKLIRESPPEITNVELAKRCGVCKSTIWGVRTKLYWKHLV